jgi:energy-coupling factor transporter ATP-binding protein EcfA2
VSSELSRNSPDPVAQALDAAASKVISAVRAIAAANPVVMIDGRSGAGKTSLARILVSRWPLAGRVQLVALDSLYPGWDGLDEGVALAREQILVPHARGMVGIWQRWDWEVGGPAEAHAIDPSLPLVIEGSGLLRPETSSLADVRVWMESPVSSRRHRALERDGESYRPHWERWARQEQLHLRRDEPSRLASHVFAVP